MCGNRNYSDKKKGCINMAIMTKPINVAFRVDEKKKDIFLHQSANKRSKEKMKKSAKQIENQIKRS